MTLDTNLITRWIAIAVLAMATAAMFAVSLRGNYLYGYSIGQSDEKRTLFAWANVAADVWKAFGLVAISGLWRDRHGFRPDHCLALRRTGRGIGLDVGYWPDVAGHVASCPGTSRRRLSG